MTDRSIAWRISGSAALKDAAAALGPNLSAVVDRAVRALLLAEGEKVPPPLPPKHNGPKPKRAKQPTPTPHEGAGSRR